VAAIVLSREKTQQSSQPQPIRSWGCAECSSVADALPLEQKKKLLQFLESRVNGKPQEKGPADLARFAGTIRLPQDPLAWQQRVRGVRA
jgi:hypothetical protein